MRKHKNKMRPTRKKGKGIKRNKRSVSKRDLFRGGKNL